jgi:hypothetical protein
MEAYFNNGVLVLFGAVAPIVISSLKNVDWPEQAKFALSLVVSVVFAALAVFMTDGLPTDLSTFTAKASIIFTLATVIYKFGFKGTTINMTLTEARLIGGSKVSQPKAKEEAAKEVVTEAVTEVVETVETTVEITEVETDKKS